MSRPIICVGGTGNPYPDWIVNPESGFRRLLSEYDLYPAIDVLTGKPFAWSGKLGGLWFWRRRLWERESDELDRVALAQPEVNFIGHSHGGQLIIHASKKLAAHGRRVRTITTISTPRRSDVPA